MDNNKVINKLEKDNTDLMNKVIKMYHLDKTPMGDPYLKYKRRSVVYLTHQQLLNDNSVEDYKLYITEKIKIKLKKIENVIIFLERDFRTLVRKFNIKIISIKNKIKSILKIFKFRRK